MRSRRQIWGGIVGAEGLREPEPPEDPDAETPGRGTADFYSVFYNDHVSKN